MSEADKMLHEIEYEFEKENDEFIIYKKDDENCYPYPIELSFNKKAKTVVKYCELYPDRLWLTMQELQAINMKCKELRLDMKVREFLKDILNKKLERKKFK